MFALSACGTIGNDNETGQKYHCDNGQSVRIYNLDGAQIYLTLLDGGSQPKVLLDEVEAASGERFESQVALYGKATEWHGKGDEAILTYHNAKGEEINTICQLSAH